MLYDFVCLFSLKWVVSTCVSQFVMRRERDRETGVKHKPRTKPADEIDYNVATVNIAH